MVPFRKQQNNHEVKTTQQTCCRGAVLGVVTSKSQPILLVCPMVIIITMMAHGDSVMARQMGTLVSGFEPHH